MVNFNGIEKSEKSGFADFRIHSIHPHTYLPVPDFFSIFIIIIIPQAPVAQASVVASERKVQHVFARLKDIIEQANQIYDKRMLFLLESGERIPQRFGGAGGEAEKHVEIINPNQNINFIILMEFMHETGKTNTKIMYVTFAKAGVANFAAAAG